VNYQHLAKKWIQDMTSENMTIGKFEVQRFSVDFSQLVQRRSGNVACGGWDVIQDEAKKEQSKSGNPMFGDSFPIYS
jgi:hypothetical protein